MHDWIRLEQPWRSGPVGALPIITVNTEGGTDPLSPLLPGQERQQSHVAQHRDVSASLAAYPALRWQRCPASLRVPSSGSGSSSSAGLDFWLPPLKDKATQTVYGQLSTNTGLDVLLLFGPVTLEQSFLEYI